MELPGLPKLAVFDVDGTLITYAGICEARTKAALEELRSAGVTLAVATGRPLAIIDETLAGIAPMDFAVCGNGATVQDRTTGALLREATLPAETVAPLIESMRLAVPGIGVALELSSTVTEEAGFAHRVPPSAHDEPVADVLAELAANPEPVRKIIFFHDDYDNDLPGLAALIGDRLDPRCSVFHGIMLPIVEVAVAGDHKAAALADLADHLGITAGDVIAFGDGENDLEMLEWAGTGVAMGNAADVTIAVADVVTASVNEGGVAVFIEALLAEHAPGSRGESEEVQGE